MTAFLAAVTQAPITAFIIVMEMVDGHAMVLSLMAAALLASLVSRWLSRPLYSTLAQAQLRRLGPPPALPAPPACRARPADPVPRRAERAVAQRVRSARTSTETLMRARTIFLLLVIALLGAFAALNWNAFFARRR